MMWPIEMLAGAAIVLGAAVATLGTVGFGRLPDAVSRLHALTKLDNLALALMALGLGLLAADLLTSALIAATWLAIAVSGSSAGQLIAGAAQDEAARESAPKPDREPGRS
jgi:multicomponent Na+:H+ antiporter subunit G